VRVVIRDEVVETVNDNNFEVDFPFGYIPEISGNSVVMMFGVSYDREVNYYWQNVTIYDSKCRRCENGTLDEKIKEKTCIGANTKICSVPMVINYLYISLNKIMEI
jgi:hypothetical protein